MDPILKEKQEQEEKTRKINQIADNLIDGGLSMTAAMLKLRLLGYTLDDIKAALGD